MAGKGASLFWEGGGVPLKCTLPARPDLKGMIQELALARREAEGILGTIEEGEEVALLLAAAVDERRHCLSCQSKMKCNNPRHNLKGMGLVRGSPKKKAPPVAPDADRAHAKIIELFKQRFEVAKGTSPAWLLPRPDGAQIPREFKAISEGLKKYGFERIAQAIDGGYAGPRAPCPTILGILADPDKYLPALDRGRAQPAGQTR